MELLDCCVWCLDSVLLLYLVLVISWLVLLIAINPLVRLDTYSKHTS